MDASTVEARLRWHARKFQLHMSRDVVLQRYWDVATMLDREALLRHACHVCAWVAFPPALPAGSSSLSPLRVLCRMLERLRGVQPTSRLRAALDLLMGRRTAEMVLCRRDVENYNAQRDDWLKIRRAILQLEWSPNSSGIRNASVHSQDVGITIPAADNDLCATQSDALVSSHTHDQLHGLPAFASGMVRTLQQVRRSQKLTLARFDALGGTDRKLEILAFLGDTQVALSMQDPDAMVALVLRGVGLLSPPRMAGAKQMHQVDSFQSSARQSNGYFQMAIRTALADLLWSPHGLDIADPGTSKLLKVPLRRLQALLETGKDSALTKAKDWVALANVVAKFFPSALAARHGTLHVLGLGSVGQSSARSSGASKQEAGGQGRGKKRNKRRSELWKPRGSKNFMEKGLVERLMKTAMSRLPGCRGTYLDIVRQIELDPGLRSLSQGKLDVRRVKWKGKEYSLYEWQNRIACRMGKFFNKTTEKIGMKAVWEARSE